MKISMNSLLDEAVKKVRNEKELEKAFKDKYGWSGDIKIQKVEPLADESKNNNYYYVTIDGMTCLLIWNLYRDVLNIGYILIGDTKIDLYLYEGEWKESIDELYSLAKKDKSIRSSLKDEYISDEVDLDSLLTRYNLTGDINEQIKRSLIRQYGLSKDIEIKNTSVYDEDEYANTTWYLVTIDGMPGLIEWSSWWKDPVFKGYILIGNLKINIELYKGRNRRDIQKLFSNVPKDKSSRDYRLGPTIEYQEELNSYLNGY